MFYVKSKPKESNVFSPFAMDTRVFNRKFYRISTGKRLARIYTIRALQFIYSFFYFFLFFFIIRFHDYISECAFQPDHCKTDTIRISVGARVCSRNRPMRLLLLRQRYFMLHTSKLQNHRWLRKDKSRLPLVAECTV